MVLFFSKLLGNFRICTSLMLLMIIVYLAQCCLIFWKKTSPLFNFFKNRLVRKSLLIKHIKLRKCTSKSILLPKSICLYIHFLHKLNRSTNHKKRQHSLIAPSMTKVLPDYWWIHWLIPTCPILNERFNFIKNFWYSFGSFANTTKSFCSLFSNPVTYWTF